MTMHLTALLGAGETGASCAGKKNTWTLQQTKVKLHITYQLEAMIIQVTLC